MVNKLFETQNSFKYNYDLKVTAAHTTDRTVLFDFITSDTFTAIQKGYYDKKVLELLDINVIDSEVIIPNTFIDQQNEASTSGIESNTETTITSIPKFLIKSNNSSFSFNGTINPPAPSMINVFSVCGGVKFSSWI